MDEPGAVPRQRPERRKKSSAGNRAAEPTETTDEMIARFARSSLDDFFEVRHRCPRHRDAAITEITEALEAVRAENNGERDVRIFLSYRLAQITFAKLARAYGLTGTRIFQIVKYVSDRITLRVSQPLSCGTCIRGYF